jgi:hypothetical protein
MLDARPCHELVEGSTKGAGGATASKASQAGEGGEGFSFMRLSDVRSTTFFKRASNELMYVGFLNDIPPEFKRMYNSLVVCGPYTSKDLKMAACWVIPLNSDDPPETMDSLADALDPPLVAAENNGNSGPGGGFPSSSKAKASIRSANERRRLDSFRKTSIVAFILLEFR